MAIVTTRFAVIRGVILLSLYLSCMGAYAMRIQIPTEMADDTTRTEEYVREVGLKMAEREDAITTLNEQRTQMQEEAFLQTQYNQVVNNEKQMNMAPKPLTIAITELNPDGSVKETGIPWSLFFGSIAFIITTLALILWPIIRKQSRASKAYRKHTDTTEDPEKRKARLKALEEEITRHYEDDNHNKK